MAQKLDVVAQLLSSHSGRDKVAKTFHYFARILKWWLLTRQNEKMADSVEQFRQAIGTSRRVGRFFSSLNSIPSLAYYLSSKSSEDTPPWLRLLLIIANASDMLYYFSDNLTFAAKYNFVTLSEKTNSFWYVSRVKCPSNVVNTCIYIVY